MTTVWMPYRAHDNVGLDWLKASTEAQAWQNLVNSLSVSKPCTKQDAIDRGYGVIQMTVPPKETP